MGLQIVRRARVPSFRSGSTMLCCNKVLLGLLMSHERKKKKGFSWVFRLFNL